MRNGGDLGGKWKICRHGNVSSVAANTELLEDSKEAVGEIHGTQGLSKNGTS